MVVLLLNLLVYVRIEEQIYDILELENINDNIYIYGLNTKLALIYFYCCFLSLIFFLVLDEIYHLLLLI